MEDFDSSRNFEVFVPPIKVYLVEREVLLRSDDTRVDYDKPI